MGLGFFFGYSVYAGAGRKGWRKSEGDKTRVDEQQ